MKKRWLAMLLAAAMALSLAACGGGATEEEGSGALTIFNSKMEIHEQMVAMARAYSEKTGVEVQIYYSSDSVAAHLATCYASDEPYVLSMVDAKDVYALAEEHGLDLSDQEWVGRTSQAISVNGKVYGFPVCVEARGILYNADAIEAVTGQPFDPASIRTTEDLAALIEQLRAGGMTYPTGVQKEDWSLAAHYLAMVYEQQSDPAAFIEGLKNGTVNLMEDPKFNALMDTFDLLRDNSYTRESPLSADRENTEQKLAKGEIALLFGGSWDWAVINNYPHSDRMGMMPVPNDCDDGSSQRLVGGGSKFFLLDSSEHTSAAQVAAAKDFLNWLALDPEGQDFLVNQCALFPAFTGVELPAADPLSASVKEYYDREAMIPNYDFLPDDHYAILGAAFQKYLAGDLSREQFAEEVANYWRSKG